MQLSANTRATVWMILACVSFAGLWVLIRLLSQDMHPFMTVVWRNLAGLLWLLPMLLTAPGLLKAERMPLHVKRAAAGVIGTFATFYAVATAPLATVLAINYSAPLFATLGAMLFLGERIRRVRTATLLLGFAGMLLVLRPGGTEMTPGLWAAVLSALATAASYLAIKSLTGSDDPRAVCAWSFILMIPISVLLAIPFWSWPSSNVWPLILGMGACAAAGQLALAHALSLADAGAMLPYDFIRFALITLAGINLFGERYDMLTIAGGGIILVSTIILALRERQLHISRKGSAPTDN